MSEWDKIYDELLKSSCEPYNEVSRFGDSKMLSLTGWRMGEEGNGPQKLQTPLSLLLWKIETFYFWPPK